jgi:rhodanese-related sulfurtransferase
MKLLELSEFKNLLGANYLVIDTRDSENFSEGFIEHSISVPFNENFISNVNDLVDEEQKILFVSSEETVALIMEAAKVAGLTNAEGILSGGWDAWKNSGEKIDLLILIDSDEFAMDYHYDEFYLLDVRPKVEFEKEHVEDAEHVALEDLQQLLLELETANSYYVYGNTLTDAVTAGSIFRQHGFNRVRVVATDYAALKNSKIPFYTQKKKDTSSNFSKS